MTKNLFIIQRKAHLPLWSGERNSGQVERFVIQRGISVYHTEVIGSAINHFNIYFFISAQIPAGS